MRIGETDCVLRTDRHPRTGFRLAGLRLAAALVAAGFAVLAGCSAGPTAWQVTVPPPSLMARVSGLFTVDSATLGPVVIDGQGYLVYRSDRDSSRPPRSTCLDACATTWLPLPAAAGLRVSGIDRQLVGHLLRPDGIDQLTLNGWPLYGYAEDLKPGDANGEGLMHIWYVIRPDGSKAGPAG